MDTSFLPQLPNEIIDRMTKELFGMDLFNFTLANEWHLSISSYHLKQLLRLQPSLPLDKEIKSLLAMSKSPYMIIENGMSLVLSSLKWNNFVYGCFKLDVIEKSLKYHSTPMFYLYCRLWSFTAFYYAASYPTLDIFEYSYLLQPRSLSVDECTLFKTWGNNEFIPQIVKTFDQFTQNFIFRYEYDIWGGDIDWDSFIIAGGSIISCLIVQPSVGNTSDIDLFFLKQNPWLFKRAVDDLENRLQNKYFVRRKTIWLNRLVHFDLYPKITISDIFNGKNFRPSVIIQLICPTISPISISRILHFFDLDICAAAFNSKTVTMTFSCLQALNSGHTTCYAVPLSTSEIMRRVPRIYKYQQRGYNILCPHEFNINEFLATPVENCKESRPERTYRFRRQQFGDNCDTFALQKQFCQHYKLI
ncbi:unnamed protein product [Rotaria magnacalcarata]|uniref:Uncharacterized protein n=1 Tax=Rotaria magnacalcarata TaxID=392030 RepID=A0A815INQ0_9BILA|nr:unnamed protein product [Rotaria magnacalcarata]CAF1648409.1 unnamed protein product [Rotaria magnacalcarata]CAF3838568.1 unnamed protein product [Rotaria magnacalcarata]CAF3844659.1 unnamed protein product [Rotaria magnacalcarata]